MADDRLTQLRARFTASAADLSDLLSGLAPDDWARVCTAEGWPVALEGLHVALGYRRQRGFLEDAFVRGRPARFDWDETHELNAEIARRRRPNAGFVVRFLADEAAKTRERLDQFTAADLERPTIDYEGRTLTLDQFIRGFLIGHVDGHTKSIRAALAR